MKGDGIVLRQSAAEEAHFIAVLLRHRLEVVLERSQCLDKWADVPGAALIRNACRFTPLGKRRQEQGILGEIW